MKTGKFLPRRFCAIVLASSLSLCVASCQLLYLPFYVVNMTFALFTQLLNMAIILPIKLLPVAIKYAPLALLFLENTPAEPVYYVEWLESNAYKYRIEDFIDRDGRPIRAVETSSEALAEWVRENGEKGLQNSSILLTDDNHKDTTNRELSKTWEVLKSRPGRIWLTGEAAEKFQNHREEIYI